MNTTKASQPLALGSTEGLGPNATDVDLWAEIHRLRAAVAGPTGYATWQDAATAERVRRVKAHRLLREVLDALPGLAAPNCLGMDLYQRVGAALGPNRG